MTNEQTTPKSGKDSLAKWVFLGLVSVGAILVWWVQRNPDLLPGWETKDLSRMLAEGKAQHRPVVIFFHDVPMNEASRQNADHVNGAQSITAYKKYNYIRVRVGTDATSAVAQEWHIESFPTLVVVDVQGKEAGRRQGVVAVTDYYDHLLPLGDPASAGAPATGEQRP